ncbi:16827_t:CDS:1, partial [Dentiscutata heterogama]
SLNPFNNTNVSQVIDFKSEFMKTQSYADIDLDNETVDDNLKVSRNGRRFRWRWICGTCCSRQRHLHCQPCVFGQFNCLERGPQWYCETCYRSNRFNLFNCYRCIQGYRKVAVPCR